MDNRVIPKDHPLYPVALDIAQHIRDDYRKIELYSQKNDLFIRVWDSDKVTDSPKIMVYIIFRGDIVILTNYHVRRSDTEKYFGRTSQYHLQDPASIDVLLSQLREDGLLKPTTYENKPTTLASELLAGFSELADDLEAGCLIPVTRVTTDGTTYKDAI